jgi:ABC-type multidrug transport system ATPase subunit
VQIELRNVSKSYGKVNALDGVSLTLSPGQIVALLGPNGAGKTTLLRCLASLVAPDEGRIAFDGELLRRDRLDLRRRFAFLPDFPVGFARMTIIQHIGMVLRLYGADAPGAEQRVVELLRDFDLLPLADVPLAKLSRGQLYKATLSAVIAVDPELWLLDEPFASGMDPHGLMAFKKRAREAASRGRTVIYSTQILDVAEAFSDRFCLIHKGRMHAYDSLARLGELRTAGGSVLEELFEKLREKP